jgi:hypothetical protein
MTIPQQIFLVFYAIFWGTSATSWPKWLPFHYTFVFISCRVARRVTWSFVMLNVVPVAFFVWAMLQLGRHTSPVLDWREILEGVVPAFAFFGFYRVWISVIQRFPTCFYYKDGAEQRRKNPDLKGGIDPTIKSIPIAGPRQWWVNLLFGLLHIIVGIVFAVYV